MSSLEEDIFEIAFKYATFKKFGGELIRYSLKNFRVQRSKTTSKMSFDILASPALCYHQAQASPNALSSSALLALFDELSTFSLFAFDKTRRPGVSVSLSTEIVRPIYEGDSVTMVTSCDKLGLILAFMSFEVLRTHIVN